MVKVLRTAMLLAATGALCACNWGIHDLLSRTTADPFTEKPQAVSFKESQTVIVSWSADDGADEYILERALDGSQIVYEEIYRGTALLYTDAGLPDQNMYLYRLAKKRGNREFPFSDPVLGVSSLITRDIYESNDRKESATVLGDTALVSNMYYYRSYSGLVVSDEDWYVVEIPPNWLINIVVDDFKAPEGKDSHFNLYVDNRDWGHIASKSENIIRNYDTSPLRCYVKLYPYENQYISDIEGIKIGGNNIMYTIRIALRQNL